MTQDELLKALSGKMNSYQGGIFGMTPWDQYRNAQSALGFYKDNKNNVTFNADRSDVDNALNGFKSARDQALVGMGMSALSGAAGIAANVVQASQIADTSKYQNWIDDMNRQGMQSFNNYDQLANAYNQSGYMPSFSVEDIRGMNTTEKVSSVGNAALTGASAGMAFGPWGAAIGGVIGGVAGWLGVKSGDRKAEQQYANLQNERKIAMSNARSNFEAAHEGLTDMNFRKGVANVVAEGGQIETKKPADEFADEIRSAQTRNDRTHSAGIIHKHCKGGTMVRIKIR